MKFFGKLRVGRDYTKKYMKTTEGVLLGIGG